MTRYKQDLMIICRHPSLLILNLSISIFLFSMVSFFAIGNQERLQCSPNGIAPGEMGNNALCAAQGLFSL